MSLEFTKKNKFKKKKLERLIYIRNINSIFNHEEPIKHIVNIKNRPATEPIILKVYNIKLSFNIWLVQ